MKYVALWGLVILPLLCGHFSGRTNIDSGAEKAPRFLIPAQLNTGRPGVANPEDTGALKKSSWYAQAIQHIEESEYEIKADNNGSHFVAPNRKQHIRSSFTASTFSIAPRNDSADTWNLQLTTLGVYSKNNLIYAADEKAAVSQNGKTIRFNHQNNFTTEYINNKEGIRQNFIITKQPAGSPQNISIKLKTNKGWYINNLDDKEIHFAKETTTGYDKKITYNSLKAWDATNKELAANFSVNNRNEISINVNTAGAAYPVTVDPLSTGTAGTPDNTPDDADQANAYFGYSVASAGDVNGDGYSDVIVGAYLYDDGPNTDEGRAFVYYGSATGLSATPNSILDDADQAGANFGVNVANAGDVNGDGYSDVIIGAHLYDDGPNTDEGRAFVYYGSASGLPATPNWIGDDADQAAAYFGFSVADAGDVNGDGYSDVIIGAFLYDDGVNANEGRVFVYYGSTTGLSATPNNTPDDADQANAYFGYCVAGAGDVNGDGFSDVIIGAKGYDDGINTDEGRAFVYYGSAAGLSAIPNSTPDDADQAFANFGISLASAGDVNGDGYSDVLIGAHLYDDGANTDEGRAFVYYGSAAGLSATPNNTPDDADQAGANFGISLACAGDVNGDGYSDIIIGAYLYNDGANTSEGRAFVYYGSSAGLSASPNSIPDDANQVGACFGVSVASAGDVNGDGYSDVIIGAYQYDDGSNTDEGRSFVYYGSPSGLPATFSNRPDDSNQAGANFGTCVAGAGDINADGYTDVIISAPSYNGSVLKEGRLYVYNGSAAGLGTTYDYSITPPVSQFQEGFGKSLASAGDVNGDGYADVIVGAQFYDDGAFTNEGRAYVYYGSATGLNTATFTTLDNANASNTEFGNSVASAGDVNGDGYNDVLVGCYKYTGGGIVYLYSGTAAGVNTTPAVITNPTGQNSVLFGNSVASAGDVNGDGFSDVVIGAPYVSNGLNVLNGNAFIYHGSPAGLSASPAVTLNSADISLALFGCSVASAGDVNGDGYSDIIIGAYSFDDVATFEEGRAWVFPGSATGINAASYTILDAANQVSAQFGYSVCSAGDVNGDGYSDVAVSAILYDEGFPDRGRVWVFYGTTAGISATPAYTVADGNQAASQYGNPVACAGDVNGDGYSDIIAGCQLYDVGFTDEGAAFVYYGNNGGGLRNNVRLYNTDLVTPIQQNNYLVPNLFGAGLYAKSFLGRTKGKMVWEVKKQGVAFSGNPITNSTSFRDKQSNFTDLGLTGTELKNQVQKEGFQTKIRARVEYDKATSITGQVYGPWRYPPGYMQGAHGMGSVPLPVTLISFNAQWINETIAQTNWITDNEINLSHFIIQKSNDGRIFTDAGRVEAKGNIGVRAEYSFDDNNVTSNASVVFYRLMMVDKNGQKSFSRVVTLSRRAMVKASVVPNPSAAGSTAILQVDYNQAKSPASIYVFDLGGRLISKQGYELKKGTNRIALNTSSLAAGQYKIVTEATNVNITTSLVIQ